MARSRELGSQGVRAARVRVPHRPRPPGERHVPSLVQGAFYLATGLWPLVHMRSFLRVTGPKTDLWLVKTVGGLIVVVGAALATAGWRGRASPELRGLALGSAAFLAMVDVTYVRQGRIPPVYLLDAAAELGLIALWTRSGPTAATGR